MKLPVTLLALMLVTAIPVGGQATTSIADPSEDVILRTRDNSTAAPGEPGTPVETPSSDAPEIDIVSARVVRTGDNLTMTLQVLGTPIGMLTGNESVGQLAYMFFLEDLAEGEETAAQKGTIGNWAEVIQCSIKSVGNLTCGAAKGNMGITSVETGPNAVVVVAELFDPAMFQHIGIGAFTLLFKGPDRTNNFFMDMTSNLDVQDAPTDSGDGPRGLVGLIQDAGAWLFEVPRVFGVLGLVGLGVYAYVKRQREAEAKANAPEVTTTTPVEGGAEAASTPEVTREE